MTPKNLLKDVTQKPEKKQIYKINQKNINKLNYYAFLIP